MKGTFSFRGERWKYEVLSSDRFDSEHGKDTCAVTLIDEYTIYFRSGETTRKDIIHELYHVLCASCHTKSAEEQQLTIAQYEELVADVFDTFYDEFSRLVTRLSRRLIK